MEDFRPVFRWARGILERANRLNFSTKGTFSSSPWPPLDPEYGAWKILNRGPRPLMVDTMKLKLSLVALRGSPNEIGLKNAYFGTDVPYAKWHQKGTRKMPKRQIVFVPPLFAQRLALETLSHIIYGRLGAAGAAVEFLKKAF
jgi:hypothetical protein